MSAHHLTMYDPYRFSPCYHSSGHAYRKAKTNTESVSSYLLMKMFGLSFLLFSRKDGTLISDIFETLAYRTGLMLTRSGA